MWPSVPHLGTNIIEASSQSSPSSVLADAARNNENGVVADDHCQPHDGGTGCGVTGQDVDDQLRYKII